MEKRYKLKDDDLEQENKILKGEKILINITNGNNDSENNEFKVLKI